MQLAGIDIGRRTDVTDGRPANFLDKHRHNGRQIRLTDHFDDKGGLVRTALSARSPWFRLLAIL